MSRRLTSPPSGLAGQPLAEKNLDDPDYQILHFVQDDFQVPCCEGALLPSLWFTSYDLRFTVTSTAYCQTERSPAPHLLRKEV